MKLPTLAAAAALSGLLLAGCQTTQTSNDKMTVSVAPYGKTKSGKPINLYALRNANGMEVDIINYGAIVTSIRVPDRNGKVEDVTLGYDTLAGWEKGTSYFGSVVGRYGNRIAKGKFTLDGKTYSLPINNGPNSLHGGKLGFNQRVWSAKPIERPGAVGVELTYVSPDGEQGYPGTLTTVVTYTLNNKNELGIEYKLTTDAPTVANVTNHTYFNLRGEGNGNILGHEMQILADAYTPTDDTLIPTGEIASVTGTPMDFRKPTPIGARINEKFAALIAGGGYDHNYVLNGSGFRKVVKVSEPESGRVMEVYTDQPGVQFYSGNFLDNEPGRGGKVYPYRSGFCLETQHFPDSPNQPNFPSTVLRPGETFTSKTVYKFSAK
jgi:Galactose mutarotase and related enzymes